MGKFYPAQIQLPTVIIILRSHLCWILRGYHFIALEEGERVVEVESSLFYRKKTQSKMRTELRILFSPGMYLFIVLD